jgi:DNA polymerase V
VGPGYARKLQKVGLNTMGDVARCSLGGPNDFHNEELLYTLFGKNAELLIDHAWGYEPCTIAEIKAYRPETNCISSGQVLHEPYSYDKTRIIVREMTELLVLDMVDKGLVTDQLTLTLGYDIENLTDPNIRKQYKGEVTTDHYGRKVPKHVHGTANIHRQTSSTKLIMDAIMELFDRIADPALLVRRVTLNATRVIPRSSVPIQGQSQQFSFFDDPDTAKREEEDAQLEREHRRQKAMLTIQKKYGKNAILKGVNFMDGATTRERNQQIGGHHE